MKRLVCEMCGGNDLVKQDGMFVCRNCGCKYSVEEARKMMIEGTVDVSGSTVKVDTSSELKNLYELARRAVNDNNSENAYRYYSQIVVKDPRSWEANFYTTYCQSMNCKLIDVETAAKRIRDNEKTIFELIKNNVTDSQQQRNAIVEVTNRLMQSSSALFYSWYDYYEGLSSVSPTIGQQFSRSCIAASDICLFAAADLFSVFTDQYSDCITVICKQGINQYVAMFKYANNAESVMQTLSSYAQLIQRYEPSYQIPQAKSSSGGGGCYIATSVYGSYDCPQVWTLRRYRDHSLAETRAGRLFIRIYYAISPSLVRAFGKTEWFTRFWRGRLDRMVMKLQGKGYESTPYSDRCWHD